MPRHGPQLTLTDSYLSLPQGARDIIAERAMCGVTAAEVAAATVPPMPDTNLLLQFECGRTITREQFARIMRACHVARDAKAEGRGR